MSQNNALTMKTFTLFPKTVMLQSDQKTRQSEFLVFLPRVAARRFHSLAMFM